MKRDKFIQPPLTPADKKEIMRAEIDAQRRRMRMTPDEIFADYLQNEAFLISLGHSVYRDANGNRRLREPELPTAPPTPPEMDGRTVH